MWVGAQPPDPERASGLDRHDGSACHPERSEGSGRGDKPTLFDRAQSRPTPLIAGSLTLHAASLGALAVAPHRWRTIAAILFADHVLLAAAGMTPRSSLLGPNLSRLPGAAARRGEVGLTFDDGPDPAVTPRVLDLLEERGAQATFFAIGQRVERYAEIASEVVRRGHRIENHSYRHLSSFSMLPPGGLRREVARAQETIERVTGRRPALFRAPAGLRSPLLEPVLRKLGLSLVSWSRRGFDTVSGDPDRVAGRLLRGLAAGDVLLLHDGSAARIPGGGPVVLEALPRVLDALEARGLRPVALPGGAGALDARGPAKGGRTGRYGDEDRPVLAAALQIPGAGTGVAEGEERGGRA